MDRPGHAPERTLFWEWQSEGADQLAALRGDFKLVITRGGKPELYDLSVDPAERRDLSATHPQQVQQLRAELTAWIATDDCVERSERSRRSCSQRSNSEDLDDSRQRAAFSICFDHHLSAVCISLFATGRIGMPASTTVEP